MNYESPKLAVENLVEQKESEQLHMLLHKEIQIM